MCTCQVRRTASGRNVGARRGSVVACLDSRWHCRRSEWNGLKRTFRSQWKASITRWTDSIQWWTLTPQLTAAVLLRCAKRQRLHQRLPRLLSRLINDWFYHCTVTTVVFVACWHVCYSLWVRTSSQLMVYLCRLPYGTEGHYAVLWSCDCVSVITHARNPKTVHFWVGYVYCRTLIGNQLVSMDVQPPDVAKMALKPSPVLPQQHLLGGSTINMHLLNCHQWELIMLPCNTYCLTCC